MQASRGSWNDAESLSADNQIAAGGRDPVVKHFNLSIAFKCWKRQYCRCLFVFGLSHNKPHKKFCLNCLQLLLTNIVFWLCSTEPLILVGKGSTCWNWNRIGHHARLAPAGFVPATFWRVPCIYSVIQAWEGFRYQTGPPAVLYLAIRHRDYSKPNTWSSLSQHWYESIPYYQYNLKQ